MSNLPISIDEPIDVPELRVEMPVHTPDMNKVNHLIRMVLHIVQHTPTVTVMITNHDEHTLRDYIGNDDPTAVGVTLAFTNTNCIALRCMNNEMRLMMRDLLVAHYGEPHTDETYDHWEFVSNDWVPE
jgi:hypothetical protein